MVVWRGSGENLITTLTQRRWWLLLVGTALVAQLVWIVSLGPREPRFDESQYVLRARNLAAGKGYTDEAGRSDAFWPPGYPAVLSVCYRMFGDSRSVGIGLQVVLAIATSVLISVLGTAAFGMRIGRPAAFLLAVYPTHVFYATLYLTEPLFTLLVTAAVLLLWRKLDQPCCTDCGCRLGPRTGSLHAASDPSVFGRSAGLVLASEVALPKGPGGSGSSGGRHVDGGKPLAGPQSRFDRQLGRDVHRRRL